MCPWPVSARSVRRMTRSVRRTVCRPAAQASRLESRPREPCHACGRHGVPLALVEARRLVHGLGRAVLLTAGVQDFGELDEDVGSEVEELLGAKRAASRASRSAA